MPFPEAHSGSWLFVKGKMKCRFSEIIAAVRTDIDCLPCARHSAGGLHTCSLHSHDSPRR